MDIIPGFFCCRWQRWHQNGKDTQSQEASAPTRVRTSEKNVGGLRDEQTTCVSVCVQVCVFSSLFVTSASS